MTRAIDTKWCVVGQPQKKRDGVARGYLNYCGDVRAIFEALSSLPQPATTAQVISALEPGMRKDRFQRTPRLVTVKMSRLVKVGLVARADGAVGLTPRLEKAVTEIAEYVEDILDNYEGTPRKFGENTGKRRYYELLAALNEIGVRL